MKCYLNLVDRCLLSIPATGTAILFFILVSNPILAEEMKSQDSRKHLSKDIACLHNHTMLNGLAVSLADTPRKILFIGNSLTYRQDGIYFHLEKLAASAASPFIFKTEKCVKGGATLKTHWERPEPRKAIAEDSCDVVVLQEDLPEINVSYFRQYTRLFVAEIRKVNARPIMLMAWSYPRLGWIGTDEIAKEHQDAANELSVEVAPVALAWQRAIIERPDVDLYAADREHPSIYGTYLATCVVYATIFGANPMGLPYVPSGMRVEDAAYLQRIAWETCQQWKSA